MAGEAMKCAGCGSENPEGSKFCNDCGASLQGTQPPSDSQLDHAKTSFVPEPERRHVTALFSDLTGYTSMAEKLDPEQVKEVTGRIFTGVKQIVANYEGFIERVMGDGVLAFFGVPKGHEDDPVRAIQAATEIHNLVKSLSPQYQEKLGAPLAMHSGINTGLVVTADVDPEKGTHGVSGDAVNVASRLSGLANPGEILVGHDTHVRAEGVFAFEDLGLKKVKGKAEPIRIFKVLGAKTSRGVVRFDRKVSSEMVGREKELDKLEFQVMKAINGEGSVVNIIGEAGIGKSRLIAELKQSRIMKRVTLLEGRAMSIGKNLSFHPITDLLKQWAAIADGDSQAVAFDKLEEAIRRVQPQETNEILPFVATLMGMKLEGKHAERVKGIEGEALEKLIFKNMRELMIKGAELRPTVVVMEDFQWADTSSIELLERLYRLAENHRIAFINVFRLGYFETDDDKIAKIGRGLPASYVEIEIHPLDNANAETLIDNMLAVKGLPYSVKNQILERAGGNPFFIEEVVRSLIDEGAVVKKKGGFEVTYKIESVTIPPTINDVLMARMDRLEEPTRELIKIASVIGRSFFDRVVKEVADPIGDVDRRLAQLKDVQLIRSRMRMGEVEYLFKHALAHEAAYESTLLKKRKQLHLRVAESIERLFSDRLHEFYGILAYHYGKAESLEKTELCLISAGEAALKSSASNEALHYYQEGLSIYRRLRGDSVDPEKVAMLEKNIGLAFFNRGHYAEAVEHFDKVLSYYWGELPKNALSTVFRLLSSFVTFFLALYFPSFWFKRLPTQKDIEAADLYHNKAEALVVIDPKRFFVESFFLHAKIVRFDFRRFKLGIAIFASASALFSWTGLSLGIARKVLDYAKPRLAQDNAKQCITYDLLDTIHRVLKGQWNEITEYNEDLVDRILRIGEMWDATMHYYWHGLPKIYQGHFDAARLMVTKLSEIAEAYENDIYRLLKYLLNIHLLIECRHIDEATTEANRGLDFVLAKDWHLHALDMHTLKASIHLLAKETEEAGRSLDQADRIRSEVQAVPSQLSAFYRSQFEYYICRLEDSLRLGHTEESSGYRKKAFRAGKMLIKTSQKVALYRTESYGLMGVYKWLIDDQKGAAKWWRKAISEGDELGARPQLARTYAEMGIRFCAANGGSSAPDVRRAKEHLQKAKQMFRDLGLNHDLEELNSAIDRMGLELSEV
jgi:class 3 adenylate cyclase/tetratricopeptide (TPR) repeat protein